jgi:hypothetical protein
LQARVVHIGTFGKLTIGRDLEADVRLVLVRFGMHSRQVLFGDSLSAYDLNSD